MTADITRDILYSEKVKEWELDLNKQLTYTPPMPLTIRDVPLSKLVVGSDDTLVKAKVIDAVVRGAEEDENLWRRSADVFPMDSEISRRALITADDFLLEPWTMGTKPRSSGGAFWAVKCDCSQDRGLYAFDISFTENDLRAGGFGKMEEALVAAGQSVGRKMLQLINAKYLADVSTSSPDMTDTLTNYGASHYKAVVKMESLIAKNGMSADIILVNPDEGHDMGIEDYFISQDYALAARGIVKDLHSVGSLFGRIPILRHRDITAASMIVAAAKKSMVVGVYHDITIKDYEDAREGIDGAIVYIQVSVRSGADAEGPSGATSPTKGAWATCTSA